MQLFHSLPRNNSLHRFLYILDVHQTSPSHHKIIIIKQFRQQSMKGNFSQIFTRIKRMPNIGKVAIGFVGLWITVWYSKHSKLSQAQYIFENTPLNNEILQSMKIFTKDFEYTPTLFLFNGFLQSLYSSWLEDRYQLNHQVQNIQGFGEVYRFPTHWQIQKRSLNPPLVIFILGAEGMSQAVIHSLQQCYYDKISILVLNPKDFHNPQSLRNAIHQIKSKQNRNIYGVGYEYGGNLLVNAAALDKDLFSAIITFGNPLDLGTTQKKIEGSWTAKAWYYKDLVKGRMKNVSLKDIPSSLKLYDIDKNAYNLSKQSDVLSFKEKNSSINNLKNVKLPYLLVQSAEDAFTINLDQRIENSKIIGIQTNRGGHHEWFQGYITRRRWGTRVLIQYIKTIESIGKKKENLLV